MEPNRWVKCSSSACPVEGLLQSTFSRAFDGVSDAQNFLVEKNISVFSFALLDLSDDGLKYSAFEFQRPLASWPQALFLRDSQCPLSTSGFSISGLIRGTGAQLNLHITYVLLVKMSVDSMYHSAHLFSLEHTGFRCISEFYFVECFLDVTRFLWGITKLVFQRHRPPRIYQLALTTALVVHNSNSFVDRIYLLIFLAFAYPLFGAAPSFISYLKIGDVSADLFWNEIVHLVLQRNSRLSFLSSRTENAVFCEIELFIRQFGLCHVWQGCDCHPLEVFLRDQSDFNDPLVVGVLRTFLLPYMSHDVDISKLLSVDCLTEIMLSSSICRAFADYHPRTIVALFENTNLVKRALRFCDHLRTLLGESKAEDWISRVFSLYQLCSEQVGIFGTSLRARWGMDWRIADYLLGRLERQSLDIDDGDDGRVPKLTQLSRRALRFALRQYLDGLPPPRPSFTAQIEALKGTSSAVKRIILAKVEDS